MSVCDQGVGIPEKYHELIFGKPHADYFIDDKAWPDKVFFNDKR